MKLKIAILAVVICGIALPAAGQANLLINGNFEAGGVHEYGFPGWHTGIMGFMPHVVARDENNKPIYNYICGCGENVGSTKPQVGFICPACKRYSVAEETGAKYNENHEYVKLGQGRSGRGVHMVLSKPVGDSQGTRCVSELVRVKRDWPHHISVDVRTSGAAVRVFVEGYRIVEDEEEKEGEGDEEKKKEDKTPVLEKSYRAQINVGGTANWQRFERTFIPPPRYAVDYLQVKLYAYLPGEAFFDNVVLRPLAPREAQAWLASQAPKKDERFR